MSEKKEHAPLSDDALDYISALCELEKTRRSGQGSRYALMCLSISQSPFKLTTAEIETTNKISAMIGASPDESQNLTAKDTE